MKAEYYVFYQTSLVLSMIALLLMVIMLLRYRKANGAKAMIAVGTGLFIWTLGYSLESFSSTLERQILFNNIAMVGTMTAPCAWLIFAHNYTMGNQSITRWRIIPFIIFPLITMLILWNSEWRHLMWQDETFVRIGNIQITDRAYGPFFWVIVIHNYLLMAIGVFILFRKLFIGVRLYVGQAISIILAVFIPLIGNGLYVFDALPIMHKDLTPVLFTISVIIFIFGIMRFNIFNVIPVAQRQIIQEIRDGVLVFDKTYHILEANPAAMKYLQLSKNDIGREFGNNSAISIALKKLLLNNSAMAEVNLQVAGEERIFELQSLKMQDKYKNHVGLLVMVRDITERKRMQLQIMAQDRLASIGELTSGVAHEINNPLAIIKGLVEYTLERSLPDDLRADMNIVNEEVDRVSLIIKSLLTFARNQNEEKRLIDINNIIARAVETRNYEQKQNNIHTITNLEPGLPGILGSEFQIHEVLVNIIINAEYFMNKAHQGGIINISTGKQDGFISISITDDGPGIPEENIGHIFNPFYTTKSLGEGTGLGLSICYGIIKEHGGSIRAENTPGKGVTFVILIPISGKSEPIDTEK